MRRIECSGDGGCTGRRSTAEAGKDETKARADDMVHRDCGGVWGRNRQASRD